MSSRSGGFELAASNVRSFPRQHRPAGVQRVPSPASTKGAQQAWCGRLDAIFPPALEKGPGPCQERLQ